MKAKFLIATAAIAIGIAAPAAHAAGKAATQVTIDGPNGDFHGYVQSADEANCEADRKVVVFKLTGSTPTPKLDQKIGSDTAEANGPDAIWSIGNSGFKSGEFYARAKGTTDCRAANSPVISL